MPAGGLVRLCGGPTPAPPTVTSLPEQPVFVGRFRIYDAALDLAIDPRGAGNIPTSEVDLGDLTALNGVTLPFTAKYVPGSGYTWTVAAAETTW